MALRLWRTANARNVRLYYPYWQYTDRFIFRFVSLLCLRRTLRLFNACVSRLFRVARKTQYLFFDFCWQEELKTIYLRPVEQYREKWLWTTITCLPPSLVNDKPKNATKNQNGNHHTYNNDSNIRWIIFVFFSSVSCV